MYVPRFVHWLRRNFSTSDSVSGVEVRGGSDALPAVAMPDEYLWFWIGTLGEQAQALVLAGER